ncbi:MAG: conjugal transfer protein TraG N-terminal domain-containing protein [Cocleimonas sp.]
MFEVYSIGNATFLIEVYRGIARLWSTGDIYTMLSVGLLLGLLWNSLLWAIDQDKNPFPAKGFILSIIFVLAFMGPQSLVDVRVTSKRDASFQEINNVPLLPALGGWLITNSGTAIADLMAQAFTVVGIANTWEALSPIQHFVGLDEVNYAASCTPYAADPSYNICKSFNFYLEECFATANLIAKGAAKPIDAVVNAKPRDILTQLKVTSPKLHTTSYMVHGNPEGESLTCPAAWTKLNSAVSSADFKNNLRKILSAQNVDLEKVDVFLSQNSMQGTIPNAESSLDLANQSFMKSVFRDYFPNSKYGQQVSRAMFDTVRQRQLANATKKEYWMENAEVMQSFFEALTVFLTPFLGLTLAVSGQGIMAVGQYFAAWAFVQLWSVMIVLVNLFTALAMTNRFTDAVVAGESQFSLSQIDSQFATANSYISIAGMMYTFIPAICVFVLYRGVHAMQGMARQAMADPNINAQRLSPDTGATVQGGNTSFGNQNGQFQNATGEWNQGDNFSKSSAMGSVSVGQSAGNSLASGVTDINSQAQSANQSSQKALENVFGNNRGSAATFNEGETTSFTASSASEWASSAAKAISDGSSLNYKEAQQIVASGAVSATAGGSLSLATGGGSGGKGEDGSGGGGMFAKFGAKFGADFKASVGLGADASQTEQQTYQANLQTAQNASEKINSNLSKISTGSEGTSFSDSESMQDSVKESAAYSKQSQALTQQSSSLGNLTTDSTQLSRSQEVDQAGLSRELKNQSIGSFLENQNPEAWNNIKNSTVDGQSGEEYLNQQEAIHLPQMQGYSVNPGGDARAAALMDLVKQNDKIDINSGENGGVNIDKEKQDAQSNKDIFSALSSAGIANSSSAAEFYDKKTETLSNMDNANTDFQKTNSELNKSAPDLTSSEAFNNGTNALKTDISNDMSAKQATAQKGQETAVQTSKDSAQTIQNQGEALTGGEIGGVSPEGKAALEQSQENLAEGKAATQSVLDAAENVIPALANAVKPGGAAAFNNFVENQTKQGADISSYTPEYADAVQSISENGKFLPGSIQESLTGSSGDIKAASGMLEVLGNDQLMTDILGKNDDGTYGDGTTANNANFDEKTISQLSAGANWLQEYEAEGTHSDTPELDATLDRQQNDNGNGNGNGAQTYLNAMQHQGLAHEASDSSDNEVFSSTVEQAASDLSKVLGYEERGVDLNSEGGKDLVSQVTGGAAMDPSNYPATGTRGEERNEQSQHLDKMENLVTTLGNNLTQEQQTFVADVVSQGRERILEEGGDRAGQYTDKSKGYVASSNDVGGRP